MVCCVCLCGLFFTRGFFSKDCLLSFIHHSGVGFAVRGLFLGGLFLTFLYSFRLVARLLKVGSLSGGLLSSKTRVFIELSPMGLLLLSIAGSYWVFINQIISFSRLVHEKKVLLFFLVVYLVAVVVYCVKRFAAAALFLLETLAKKRH